MERGTGVEPVFLIWRTRTSTARPTPRWCPRTESNRALRSTKPVRRQLRFEGRMERVAGFEPAVSTLATWRSATEPHPHMVEHAGVEPAASGPPDRRASDAPVLEEWSQRVESNHPRPGMNRLPRRSASLRMEGSLGIEPSPAISRTALCACAPHDVEIPVGPAPTWTRVAIWCFVCFSLGITMDGERGIEPRPTRSERVVLPLHQSPTNGPSGSTRTTGLPRIRRVLCQLSYARTIAGKAGLEPACH
jgi:hypothetical protein